MFCVLLMGDHGTVGKKVKPKKSQRGTGTSIGL